MKTSTVLNFCVSIAKSFRESAKVKLVSVSLVIMELWCH